MGWAGKEERKKERKEKRKRKRAGGLGLDGGEKE